MHSAPKFQKRFGPKYTESEVTGEEGENFVREVARKMRCRWTGTEKKYGAQDGFLELFRGENSTGLVIGVEVKSGTSHVSSTSQHGFVIRIDRADIAHWARHGLPFIVVWYNPRDKRAYWRRTGGPCLNH